MSVIYILWLREVKKYLRSRVQIVASLGSPLMYLGVLGFGLGPVFQRAGEGKYLQFMAPGVIGMTVLFTAMFSGIAMLWDRQFGFLKETLVAPVPRLLIMIGRTPGGATVAVLQGSLIFVVTLIAGFRPASLLAVPLAFLMIALIAVIFSALATALGSSIKEMQGFQMVMNFLVMPLFFLSGAIYPLEGLPRVLAALTRVDPLTYGVDGVRGLLTGRTHFGVPLDIAVLSSVGVLGSSEGTVSRQHSLVTGSDAMSGVRVLVGTRKGAFILTSDSKRSRWEVSGPHFAGWEIYHMKGSPADPDRIYASQTSGWLGQV